MQKKKSVFLILIFVVICLLVSGCNFGKLTDSGEKIYTVKFISDKGLIWKEEVISGQFPTEKVPEMTGYKFYGWRDEKYVPTEPGKVAVTSNVTYYADFYPDLSSHEPYLFLYDNCFLHPDGVLTNDDLSAAIHALATADAKSHLPKLPSGAEEVTAEKLTELLLKLFPQERVESAAKTLNAEKITRADLAVVMNALLERSEAPVALPEDTLYPYDLPTTHKNFADLAEAMLPHTHADTGDSWVEAAAKHKHPEGFFNVDGWLYHINSEGTLTVNSTVGTLAFGSDGRFTSTDAELDQIVADILADIMEKNPDAPRIDLLRRAFEYSRDSFSYLRRNAYDFGAKGWEIEDAKKMFTTKRGNCYSYAATFWALARGLGYDAVAISGTMTKTYQPHSWVEIAFDGEYFVFDPEMEMVYRTERDIFDRDMFMVDYVKGQYWTYVRPQLEDPT